MKKLTTYLFAAVVLILLSAGEARAQHYFGIRGEYGNASSRIEFERGFENQSIWGLYSGGVAWKYYTDEKFLGGLEVNALYMQQGFKKLWRNNQTAEPDSAYVRNVDVVMVPIMWQPHIYMFKQRLRVFMNAGVTFSYVIGSSEKEINYVTGETEKRDYQMRLTRDNRFAYGLCGGGGASWAFGRLEVFAEARYYIGYSDILKNSNKNEENEHLRSPLDAMRFSVGMFWRMGSGGIRSEQGRPAAVSEEAALDLIQNLPEPKTN